MENPKKPPQKQHKIATVTRKIDRKSKNPAEKKERKKERDAKCHKSREKFEWRVLFMKLSIGASSSGETVFIRNLASRSALYNPPVNVLFERETASQIIYVTTVRTQT